MAIDARLLLAGVVPDVADSAAKGFALGQGIRNAPILRQMQQQRLAQGEQGLAQGQQLAAQNEMKLGRASAQAINSVIGDSTAEQITPDVFAQSTRALADLGVPLDDDDLTFSPENVTNLLKISAAGKQINLESRGAGQTGFQTNAPVITEQPRLDADGNAVIGVGGIPVMDKYFTSLQSDRASGEQRVSSIKIDGALTDKLGLNAGDRVSQAQQLEIAKNKGAASVDASTAGARASAAAEEARQVSAAKDQQKTAEESRATAGGLSGQLRSIDKAIAALDKGAKSGVVQGRLPAFDVATEQLRSAAKTLGIEVINSATFGALSATELQLALSTAVPDNLDEEELKQFLVEKRGATAKLRDEFNTMSRFLSKKGNTVDRWLDIQDTKRADTASEQGATDLSGDEISELEALRAELNQ